MPGHKRLWAEEYNRTSKALRRSWAGTLREIKTAKSRKGKWGGGDTRGKHIHISPDRTHAQRRPKKLLSLRPVLIFRLRALLISKGFPC